MKVRSIACVLALAGFTSGGVSAAPAAPAHAGQQAHEIKALSADEVDAYLAGKGMGLAKAAELNGYAGPAHVLELASRLELTPGQRARTEALHASMASKAASLGRALIDAERRFDRLFATKTVDRHSLSAQLAGIGALQARIRGAHLEAHLAQAEILTLQQSARYAELRGYGSANEATGHDSRHKH